MISNWQINIRCYNECNNNSKLFAWNIFVILYKYISDVRIITKKMTFTFKLEMPTKVLSVMCTLKRENQILIHAQLFFIHSFHPFIHIQSLSFTIIHSGYSFNNILVHGKWTTWTSWSNCRKCGGNVGVKKRRRWCTNPKPSNGGRKCEGDSIQAVSCKRKCDDGW